MTIEGCWLVNIWQLVRVSGTSADESLEMLQQLQAAKYRGILIFYVHIQS